MKKICLLNLSMVFVIVVFSQQQPARILGTFVYQKKVYNYDFSRNGTDMYSFKISTVETQANENGTGAEPALPTGVDSAGDAVDSAVAHVADTSLAPLSDSAARALAETVAAAATDTTATDAAAVAFDFSSFELETFRAIFVEQMISKFKADVSSTAAQNRLRDKATEVFSNIKGRLDFNEDEPVTAYMILKKDIITSFLESNSSVYYDEELGLPYTKHYVERVSVETEDGAIKNITVHLVDVDLAKKNLQSPRSYLEFKNQYPISISGKYDPEKFADISLYSFNCAGIRGLKRYIKLSDLLLLDIVLENDKEDYSPAKRTITLTPGNPIVELKKEKRSRILDIAAFTDFAGLDQEEPNGLIQIEAKRRINLNTKSWLLFSSGSGHQLASKVDFGKIQKPKRILPQYEQGVKIPTRSTVFAFRYKVSRKMPDPYAGKPLPKFNMAEYKKILAGDSAMKMRLLKDGWHTITVKNTRFRSPYFTMFSSIEPKLLFSKLEENNRVLDSSGIIDKKINPLRLYKYQLASFGVMLNVLRFNFPQLKFNWNFINVGYYWYRTRIGDSADTSKSNSIPLNSHYWQVGTKLNFQPDSRWGASMGFDYIRSKIWNPNYELEGKHGLIQLGFDGFYKTSENGKLFFRYRWTHEHHERKNNFTQIQLGYSMNLFTGPTNDK